MGVGLLGLPGLLGLLAAPAMSQRAKREAAPVDPPSLSDNGRNRPRSLEQLAKPLIVPALLH